MRTTELINTMFFDMEKTALNAEKARAMAHDAGLFPEGQWRWALRNLRDDSGNLLQGKEMADAKLSLGAMKNNPYQRLQKLHREEAQGSINPKYITARYSTGTEIGGEMGPVSDPYRGELGLANFGNRGGNDIPSGSRAMKLILNAEHSFHTHPVAGQLYDLAEKRKTVRNLHDHANLSNPVNIAKLKDTNREINRLSGKRNPLIASPSGMSENTPNNDYYLFSERAKRHPKATMDTIIAPELDIEGIHRMRPQGMRSIYFDRLPRKMRKETSESQFFMEKVALNAQKARVMAHDAGLFPEGQWRWALRNLRDSRGNLLQGKEMADAKLELGSLHNNDYQWLKSVNRKYTPGTYHHGEDELAESAGDALPKDSYQGTEIGGAIANNGIGDMGIGARGAGFIHSESKAGNLTNNYRHGFHTHPNAGRIAAIHKIQNNIRETTEAIENPDSLSAADRELHDDDLVRRLKALNYYDRQSLKRRAGGRNPLLASPSGDLYKPGTGVYNRDEVYSTGGDLKLGLTRAKGSNNQTIDSIFAPDIDVEGIHKVKDNGSVRSIYLDRGPRKAR